MARDAIVHDVDLPSLEYDDEETAYMATETPSFDADDATLGSTFVIVDEDTVSDPDDDVDGVGEDDDVSPLVMRPATTADSRSSLATAGKVKFLDKIRENKSYQKLARIVKKKGLRPVLRVLQYNYNLQDGRFGAFDRPVTSSRPTFPPRVRTNNR